MKKIITMNTRISFLAFLFVLLSCENPIEMPFKAGLGPVQDIQPPTITLDSPKAGKYIFGSQLFRGSAEDDYELDKVEFWVTSAPDFKGWVTDAQKRWTSYERANLSLSKQNKGDWSVLLDTTLYRDGDMKIRLRVWDTHGKSAQTDEIAFYIKNEPTLINLTAPYIARGQGRGEVGGDLLNDGTEDTLKRPGMNYKHKVGKGDSITGQISHDEGIYTGPETGGRYPPQIRFWRVNDKTDSSDTDGYEPGELPPLNEVPWHTLIPNKELILVGLGSYIFNYAIPKNKDGTDAKTDCYYGFEIRAQNDDGRSSVHYPRSYYPDSEWDESLNPNAKYYSYVLIYYSPDNETPVVVLYELQDVNDYWANGNVISAYPYQTLKNAQGNAPLTDHEAHPYVNNLTVDKNGEFILRIRASHSEGIGAAEVYWENKEANQRGRFIWDFAAESNPRYAGMPNQDISEARWDLDVRNPYSQWGYKEPYAPYLTSGKLSRSFFFHYRHNGYRIPLSGGGGFNNVWGGGRTQVQLYSGSLADWEAGKRDGRFGRSNDGWQDMTTKLDDGVYRLEVYARTPSLSAVQKSLLDITLRLDTQKPVVTFNKINKVENNSVYTQEVDKSYIVNGVIQPTVSFKDPVDLRGSSGSNPRLASTGSYFKNGSTLDYEQFFILIDDASKTALDGKIKGTENWWPVDNTAMPTPFGDGGLIAGEVTGINVKRNAPVFNGIFKVKTSKIYTPLTSGTTIQSESDDLADGKYWIYVFCRDNAFNVGCEKIELQVRKEKDLPELDFGVGAIKKVTDPNQSADGSSAGFKDANGAVRNKLAGGSSIRLTLRDDDCLDLGTSALTTGVTVEFTGSYTDTTGLIEAWADKNSAYNVSLTKAQVEFIFPRLPSASEAVTSRTGEIGQAALVEQLKSNSSYNSIFPSYGASLPDGMYRFTITVKDYRPLKMKLSTSDPDPVAETTSESFWVVVDSKAPEYKTDADSAPPGAYLQNGVIKGNVWDKNGPIEIIGSSVSPANTQATDANKISFNVTKGARDTTDTNNWKYPFTATVAMNGASGDFRFEITFEDRFGNTSTLSQVLKVDGTPPTAAIGTKITTFERDYPDVTNGGVISQNNKLRLANGVLNFNISANDNIKVAGVKWWLVPAGTPGPKSGDISDYNGYTAAIQIPSELDGTAGKEFNKMQFIDTKSPNINGEYTLYVMAIDNAGNVSDIDPNSTQTIYLLQEQDKPYFGYWNGTGSPPITPAALDLAGTNLMVTDDAVIRGVIYDDDSFDKDGTSPITTEDDSIRIWMSVSYSGTGLDVDDDSSLSTYGFGTPMTYDSAGGAGKFKTGLSRLRKGVLSMNINLKDLFSTSTLHAMDTDGIKYYIIEAKDSVSGKFTGSGMAETERVTRRKLFSFIYDTTAPVISLSYPDKDNNPVVKFGPNANIDTNPIDASTVNFHLKGTIKDANLKQITDPADNKSYYYFEYYLDSGTRKTFILNTTSADITVTPNGVTPPIQVDFTVSAQRFCAELDFMNSVTPDVTHTLTLVVQDRSGKEGSCSFNFVKDLTPPSLKITDPAGADKNRLPWYPFPVNNQNSNPGTEQNDWWAVSSDGADLQHLYQLKHIWEKTNMLPIISYNTGVPQLKVTFTDITSTIANGTLKYWIDNEPDATFRTTFRAASFSAGNKSYSLTLDLTTTEGGSIALSDGIHSIRFEIEDSVGNKLKSSDANGYIYYGFRISSSPPTITVVTPPVNGNVYGVLTTTTDIFNMVVQAKGANLQDVQMHIKYPDAAGYTPITWTSNSGLNPDPALNDNHWKFVPDPAASSSNNYWIFGHPAEELTWTQNIYRSNLGSVREGNYELELTARGRDNKSSDPPSLWTFTVDNSPPKLDIYDFPAGATLTSDTVTPAQWKNNATGKKVFTKPTDRIQGLISDQYSNLKEAQILIQRYNYASGAWGDCYVSSSITDTAGNWDAIAITNDSAWSNIFKPGESKGADKLFDLTLSSIMGANGGDGLYRVRLRAKDSAFIDANKTGWSVGDNGHPTYSNYYYFFYAPTNPTISFADDTSPVTLYSAKVSNGTLTFDGTATSGNGYEKLEVKVERGSAVQTITTALDSTTPMPNAPPWNGNNNKWGWIMKLGGSNASNGGFDQDPATGDGSYRLTFTVTDLAGNSTSISRNITLDNMAPKGNFTKPDLLPSSVRADPRYAIGSETFYGGEYALISGTTEDTNEVAGVWYHLGYTQSGTAGTALSFPSDMQIWQSVLGAGVAADLGGKANNDKFDAAAKAASGEAWFKYETGYPQAPGFSVPATFILEDWKLEIPSTQDLSKMYAAVNFTVKGISYNSDASGYSAGRRMVQKIDESGLPSSYYKNGLYSLPLWVRVADKAGNVSYFKQDIWLYPNGDYPTNGITNPAEASPQSASRGGTVSFDGIASDNVNVKSVIYRIRADNYQSNNADYGPNTDKINKRPAKEPPSDQIIRLASPDARQLSTDQKNLLTGSQGSTISGDGWYIASLEGEGSIAKTKAWSFYVNANDEFTTEWTMPNNKRVNPIRDWGFRSAGAAANDMIRVYVEILVFDGADVTYDYHLMSLGNDENKSSTTVAPHVVVFYLSSTSPTITFQKLSDVGAFNGSAYPYNANYSDYAGGKTRSGKFSVRMQFDSGSTQKNISQVQVRLPSETGSNGDNTLLSWKDAWNSTSTSQNLPGVTFAATTALTTPINPPAVTRSFVMHYGFDTASSAASGFQQVMKGNWAATGGKYVIEVRLRDSSSPSPMETTYRFELGIDNFAPIADETRIISNTKVAGSNQQFMGRVYDYEGSANSSSPSPGYYSIEKVYAWFTKDQDGMHKYVNMNQSYTTSLPTDSVPTDSKPGWKGRTATGLNVDPVTNITGVVSGTLGTITYPQPGTATKNDVQVEVSTAYVKVITESEAAEFANNMNWQPITAGRSVLWSFMTDTTLMPDGWVYLNYLVVDGAGNASLYQQKMVVMNNYPVITDLTLYTDNTGEGAVFTTHEGNDASSDYKVPVSMPDGYLNTGFISKNMYIGFRVQTAKGNPPLNYRVQYVERSSTPIQLTQANLLNIANDISHSKIYTIANKGDMGDAIWATLMDVPAVTATAGMHFMFKAKAADLASWKTDYTATVYAYTPVGSLKKEKLNLYTNFVDDKNYPQSDSGFRFSGNTEFGTSGTVIPEKMGSHPPEEGGSGDNPANTAFFLIKVWDTVILPGETNDGEDNQLYDALVVGMNVWLNDKTPATARLYDLNPYTETAVVGNNIGDLYPPQLGGAPDKNSNQYKTIRNAADPIAVGSNIVRSGLFNTKLVRDLVKSGYIEPRDGSKALSPVNSSGVPGSSGVSVPDSDYPLKVPGETVSSPSGTTLDKVSGRIILRGLAWDDQLIDEIRIKIGGDNEKCILKLDNTTETINGQTVNVRKMLPQGNNLAFAAETLHWQTGHTVEWAYVWDTEKEPSAGRTGGGPSTGVSIQVKVKDMKSNILSTDVPVANETSDATGKTFHNGVSVDIVPYITGFERETPQFTTKRSLQGWYSFYQGEDNIALLGYNFGQSESNVTVYLNSGSGDAPITPVYTPAASTNAPANIRGRLSFKMPTAANSGKLDVQVDTVRAYNHTSNSNKSWNKESNSNTPGSTLWINKPYAHIWRTTLPDTDTSAPRTYIGTLTGSSGLDHPGMALEYAPTSGNPGTLHGTWAVYGKANSFYGTNGATNNFYYLHGDATNTPGEPFSTPDISIFAGGGASAANIGYTYQTDGRPRILLRSVVTSSLGRNDYGNTTASIVLQNYGVNGSNERWQNLRISKAAVNGSTAVNDTNVGRIYMTAYNGDTKGLWYGSRSSGANTTNTTLFIDGTGNTGIANPIANVTGLTDTEKAGDAGEYSAVDYDDYGPIIAYYDKTNDTVRIAMGAKTTPPTLNPTATQWTRRYLLPTTGTGSQLRRGSGKYISMKVDKNNGIHLAFYNSVYNTVVYYYAANRDVINVNDPPVHNATTVKIHTVDNVITGGTWTDISVDDNGKPWIVYGDSSRTGNYDGVRIAYESSSSDSVYFQGTLTCPVVTNISITGWEAVSMPSNYKVNNDRLNIEVWPPTNRAGGILPTAGPSWSAAIGYASDIYRVGYFYRPNFKGY